MVFTIIHEISDRQVQIEDRAATIRENQRSLDKWRSAQTTTGGRGGGNEAQWPVTNDELKDAKLSKNAVAVLQELAQQSPEEKKHMDAEIETGLKVLAARFKHHPLVPRVPDHVWQAAATVARSIDKKNNNIDTVEFWHKKYPAVNAETAAYLFKMSQHYDLVPYFLMFAIGDYFHFLSQSWTDEEFKAHVEGMKGIEGLICGVKEVPWPKTTSALTPKIRAKLLAKLVYDVINYANACEESVNMEDLENAAMDIKMLPMSLLQMAMKQFVVAADRNNKAALVVKFVEHLFSDVIEPAASG